PHGGRPPIPHPHRRRPMTERAPLDDYGELTAPATLTIQRLLPGPIERVWAYLTESDLRRTWLAAGEMALQVGAPFELVWRNDDLTDPPGQRPPGVGAEHRMPSRILELEPPAAGLRPAAASLTARTACRRRAPPLSPRAGTGAVPWQSWSDTEGNERCRTPKGRRPER